MSNDNENPRWPFRELSVDELYEIANEKGIPSISSSMSKEELIDALEKYRGEGEQGEAPSESSQYAAG